VTSSSVHDIIHRSANVDGARDASSAASAVDPRGADAARRRDASASSRRVVVDAGPRAE
jgi:hypothetical protein